MANTYVLIASNTLTSSAASVTFSSIPGTYTDLVIQTSVRSDRASTLPDSFALTINSDTATNYSRTGLRGDGSAASSVASANNTNAVIFWTASSNNTTSNTFGSATIYIPSYTASQNKPISTFGATENNNATAYLAATANLWRNTAAITSLQIAPTDGSNWLTGSSFFLYGIKNS